jgi:hypothetical protein
MAAVAMSTASRFSQMLPNSLHGLEIKCHSERNEIKIQEIVQRIHNCRFFKLFPWEKSTSLTKVARVEGTHLHNLPTSISENIESIISVMMNKVASNVSLMSVRLMNNWGTDQKSFQVDIKGKMGQQQQPTITEYSIRVPKTNKNKHHIMRFNYNLNVDFSKWRTVR